MDKLVAVMFSFSSASIEVGTVKKGLKNAYNLVLMQIPVRRTVYKL
jgi:hypothetical protein